MYPATSHNQFELLLSNNNLIKISSKFDNGNLEHAAVVTHHQNQQVQLTPAFDIFNQETSVKPTSKTYFHFKVSSKENQTVRFVIKRMKILKNLIENGQQYHYKPCYKKRFQKQYKRYESHVDLSMHNDQVDISFRYTFCERDQVYFAFNFPYPYTKMLQMVRSLDQSYRSSPLICFHKQSLIYSLEGRSVPLLSITSYDNQTLTPQDRISNAMFPESAFQPRPCKFKKPIILVTARVHPGQSSSSYAVEGLIQFLLDRNDFRAQILRRFFQFLIVPMVNPDGVYRGMYRMDSQGVNLNRFYNNAQSHKHPTIFAIRNLIQHYEKQKKLAWFFDIHSHANRKGFYLYGNAVNDFAQQVETKIFGKLMSINCNNFQYSMCNYSKNQMSAKDSNQIRSKQGCARVVAHRLGNIFHTYTLEIGFHSCESSPALAPQNNLQYGLDTFGYTDYNTRIPQSPLFEVQHFKQAGRALLISVLDIYELNPYSRLLDKDIRSLRQTMAKDVVEKDERFRQLEQALQKKIKSINITIFTTIIQPLFKKFNIKHYSELHKQEKQEEKLDKEEQPRRQYHNEKYQLLQVPAALIMKPSTKELKQNHTFTKLETLQNHKHSSNTIKNTKIQFNPIPPFLEQQRYIYSLLKEKEISPDKTLIQERRKIHLPRIPPHESRRLSLKEDQPTKQSRFSIELRLRRNYDRKYMRSDRFLMEGEW